MSRRAGVVLAGLALLAACVHRPPSISSGPVGLAASFKAAGRGPEGRIRLTGLLAAAPHGRLRVEIPGPAASLRFILVVNEQAQTMVLGAQRLYHKGPPGEPILMDLLGVDLPTGSVADLLSEGQAPNSPDCTVRPSRFRETPEGALVATRIAVRCGRSNLHIRLTAFHSFERAAWDRAFASLPVPEGSREASRGEFVEALRAGPGGGAGGP